MEISRKPFQGVSNIVRFNWQFYFVAVGLVVTLSFCKEFFAPQLQILFAAVAITITVTTFISLLVSWYIYDMSGIYQLKWLEDIDAEKLLNINAGFDETSGIIEGKFPNANLTICDFYDPIKNTEISIKRARNQYPPHPKTITVNAEHLPFADKQFDKCIVTFAAHEIRDNNQRIEFFKELNRVTNSSGQILVTEHLRNLNNFLAYTLGFLHFYSFKNWLRTFKQADLKVKYQIRNTAFVTTFILEKNGNTL